MVFLKGIHHLTRVKKAHFCPSPLLLLSAMTILPRISCLYLIITAYLYLVIFGHFEWGPQHSLLFSSHKIVKCICTEYSMLHLCGGEKKEQKSQLLYLTYFHTLDDSTCIKNTIIIDTYNLKNVTILVILGYF